MDEYEKLEQELERHYNVYIEKFKNLDFLEYELDKFNKREIEKKVENEKQRKKLQEKYNQEEFNNMGSTRTGFNKGNNFKATGDLAGESGSEDSSDEGEDDEQISLDGEEEIPDEEEGDDDPEIEEDDGSEHDF